MNTFQVVCIEVDYFSPVELDKAYTVTDIIEAGSEDETYILEEEHPGCKEADRILAYSTWFVTLDEWRERQLKKIGL